MANALYRISSGEVYEISSGLFLEQVNLYVAIELSVTLIDGSDCVDPAGDLRVLGYAKIKDGTNIRNATQIEIDTFEASNVDDNNQREADRAIEYFQNHPAFRRIMIAYTDTLIDHEINVYRQWLTDFKTQVAASTSLANFQTRVAAMPAMPQRTLSQMRTQILDRIDKDD